MNKTKRLRPLFHQELTDYYLSLRIFFSAVGGFPASNSNLHKLILAAFTPGLFLENEYVPLFQTLQSKMKELIECTYRAFSVGALDTIPAAQKAFYDDGAPKPEFFCPPTSHEQNNQWDYFPRFISKKDFLTPHFFFKSFFAYKPPSVWTEIMDDLFHSLITTDKTYPISAHIESPILLYYHLLRFLETSHIVYIRHGMHLPSPRSADNSNSNYSIQINITIK